MTRSSGFDELLNTFRDCKIHQPIQLPNQPCFKQGLDQRSLPTRTVLQHAQVNTHSTLLTLWRHEFRCFFFLISFDSFSSFHCKDPVTNHSLCQKKQPSFRVPSQPVHFTALLSWAGLEEKAAVSSKGTILLPWEGIPLLEQLICPVWRLFSRQATIPRLDYSVLLSSFYT